MYSGYDKIIVVFAKDKEEIYLDNNDIKSYREKEDLKKNLIEKLNLKRFERYFGGPKYQLSANKNLENDRASVSEEEKEPKGEILASVSAS